MRDAVGPWILFAIVPAACGYRSGSFAFASPATLGGRATLGCVDVVVSRRADHRDGPVLAYAFGNGCDRAVVVELAAIPVVTRHAELRPYDPERELRPLLLDGRSVGAEAIEYRSSVATSEDVVCARPGAAFGYDDHGWTCLSRASELVAP